MGPAGQPLGLLLGRHDAQDLVHEAGHVRSRSAGPQQGDLHHQVVPHRAGHEQSQHEPHLGEVGPGGFGWDEGYYGARKVAGMVSVE